MVIEAEITPVEASVLRWMADHDGVSQSAKIGELIRREYKRRMLLREMARERERAAWERGRQRPRLTFDDLWAMAPYTRD